MKSLFNLPRYLRHLGLLTVLFGRVLASSPAQKVDIVVYGATPGGIAAALAAAQGGQSVLLIEPSVRIGGLTTNGLAHPDLRTFEGVSGRYRELMRRTEKYYRDTYGPNSQQVKDCFNGSHSEPKINLMLFEQMLREQKTITVKTKWELVDARVRGSGANRYVTAALFKDATGVAHTIEAEMFIDGSYEGDLMAAAQVPYRLGREGQEEYGEPLAPPEADRQLQGYSFRLIMTQNPANRVMLTEPAGYDRKDYEGLLPLIEQGRITRAVGGYQDVDNVIKAQIPVLPNGKRDMNDVSRGLVRLSLPGHQLGWPEGDSSVRRKIYDEHMLWHVGLLYFAQNDPAIPARFREDARTWGWARDEFPENNHLPPQIYVREARRLVGQYVFTQHDTDYTGNDVRTALHKDAVAMYDFGLNCHGTGMSGSRFGGERHGEFYQETGPYQVPYGVIVPKDVRNLLVPVALSASHVGFNALRYEAIWSALGQAAGHAARLALSSMAEADVRKIKLAELQAILHQDGVATIYLSDVLPENPDFAAAQWWGLAGGWHGLNSRTPDYRPRGEKIMGMHHKAARNHSADLDRVLDSDLAARWTALAAQFELKAEQLPKADGKVTRGDWLRKAFALYSKSKA